MASLKLAVGDAVLGAETLGMAVGNPATAVENSGQTVVLKLVVGNAVPGVVGVGNLGMVVGNPSMTVGNSRRTLENPGMTAGNSRQTAGNPGALFGDSGQAAGNSGLTVENPKVVLQSLPGWWHLLQPRC